MMQNDPTYEMHVDEDDNKYSPRQKQTEPDFDQKHNEADYGEDSKMQRLYESKQGGLPNAKIGQVRTNARNSRQSLPKVVGSLSHSIQ